MTHAGKDDAGRVTATGLSRRFASGAGEVPALTDVDLVVEHGSAVALCGPSGSGKSTLLHLVGGMDRPDAGRIVVGGQDVTAMTNRELVDYRRTVGFVFQRFLLLPALSALDNVIAAVLPFRTGFDKQARARELLDVVGLGHRVGALPGQLSGGEQQRVAMARALMGGPRLLLADEPTGNLDTATGAEVIDLLLRLRDEREMTVLIATHDMTVAARCDRVVRLADGRVVDDVAVAAAADPERVLRRVTGLRSDG